MTYYAYNFGSQKEMSDFLNGKAATGILTMPEPRHLTDEQAITISDGSTAVEFRVDAAGDGIGGGDVALDTSSVVSKADLAAVILAAVNGHAFNVTATDGGDKLKLANDASGAVGNVAITQGVGGSGLAALPIEFGIEGMSGGADAVVASAVIGYRIHHERWHLLIDV